MIIQEAKMAKTSPSKSTFSNLFQVAIVVRDMDKTVKRLESLGIGPFTYTPAPAGAEGLFFRGKPLTSNYQVLFAQLGDLELEIFQPDDKPSPWKEFLDTKGEGIHHLAFKVNDVEKEVDKLIKAGAEVILSGNLRGKLGMAYLDLKVGDIFVELVGI
jgi:methylmalonyl-CoA/ethylmalonyl-CoA epimerase